MALDGIFLYSIKEELKSKILNGKVDKIYQPEKDEILLNIRNEKKSYRLIVSASAAYPRIHLTDESKQNPKDAPMFCMVLRKHLTNAKIVNIKQLETDRVLFIDFENSDELGYKSIYTLIVEIMGRHSNITLLRKRDNIIMDSIKHVTPDMSSIRCLYPGIPYVYPPSSKKLNPFEFTSNELSSYMTENSIALGNKFFSDIFTGVSTALSREMFKRINNDSNISREDIYSFCISFFERLKKHMFNFSYYIENGRIKEFSCIEMTSLSNLGKKSFDSASELMSKFYTEKDKSDKLNYKSANLSKLVSTNLERCYKKQDILKNTYESALDLDKYKLYGELLTANLYCIKEKSKETEVINYYSNNNETVKIKLDPNKTAVENSQCYYKKYNKMKNTLKSMSEQLDMNKKEIEYLESVLTNIKNAEDYDTIDEIKKELISAGYIKFKKSQKSKDRNNTSKPLHFISCDGIDIYVGKNNIQNDYLTLKFADKHDTWMHTKNIPGSHVIIKKYGKIPDATLMQAAGLAAYYSKAKEAGKVPVDYTEVKNVHKPNGAKPGMVIYYTNKTLYVAPEKISNIKD